MTLTEILNEELLEEDEYIMLEDGTLEEAKVVGPLDYKRHWHVFGPHEIHYSKKTGRRLEGCWVYDHREAAGAKYGDGKVVHHKDHDKHDNRKSNLQKITRAKHCEIDPNARKHTGCKVPGCSNPHFCHGYCEKHYMERYRKEK